MVVLPVGNRAGVGTRVVLAAVLGGGEDSHRWRVGKRVAPEYCPPRLSSVN